MGLQTGRFGLCDPHSHGRGDSPRAQHTGSRQRLRETSAVPGSAGGRGPHGPADAACEFAGRTIRRRSTFARREREEPRGPAEGYRPNAAAGKPQPQSGFDQKLLFREAAFA